jgi:uncharacterized membrane protein
MFMLAEILIALLGFCGFLLANYIRDTKKGATPLVCPLEGSCETVIHSDYSKFLGIPVELIGIFYYGLVTLSYFLFAFFPTIMPSLTSYIILGITTVAFVFSLYLTAVQSLLIKHWCTWCLISAGICTVIFIIATYASSSRVLELIQNL